MERELLTERVIIDGHRIAAGRHPAEGGAKADLVLLHGTPSHSFIWREIAPRLVASGFNLYLYDLLGFGRSERPVGADTSVAAQGPILSAMLRHWGLDRPHIIAHDIGGAIGLRHAILEPDPLASLTVIDICSYDSWPSETWKSIIASHMDSYASMPAAAFRDLLTRQLRMTVHDESRMEGEVLEAYLAPISGPVGRLSFFHHQVRHYDSRYTEEISHRLAEIACPVQIIWGAEDRWQPLHWAKRLAKDIPGARLDIVPEAGHFLMEDAPDAVVEHLVTFLQTVKP
ncbi:alpha/beta fold hydrolase [Rhodospirillaceae bacterium SYSU D60014]|uniref:alpha/beta fold hydrolase n=1 Tax=Virgifigura deserti TaxID=2268457 RepID=UPI000E665D91